MASLIVRLLGSFEVHRDGDLITNFAYDKVRALLAYLITEAGHPQRRQHLVGLLWPDYPERSARQNLSQALFSLRAAIGDEVSPEGEHRFLLATRQTVMFSRDGDTWLDLAAFNAAVNGAQAHAHPDLSTCQPCLARLARAIDLYRGDFLQDLSIDDSTAFEEWMLAQREEARRRAIETLDLLSRSALLHSNIDAALTYARRQVAVDPLSEAAHRQLMQALVLDGRRSAALAQYDVCEAILRKEIGIAPSEETTRLRDRIRAGELPPAVSGKPVFSSPLPGVLKGVPAGSPTPEARDRMLLGNLLMPSTSFVGRERDTVNVVRRLRDPTVRLLTLVGAEGVGKTRLALRAAREASSDYPDGAYATSLGSLRGAAYVLPTIADALGVRRPTWQSSHGCGIDQPVPEIGEELEYYLKDRHLLLVLDDVDHVRDAAREVVSLLSRVPGLTILATSRIPLGIHGEHIFSVDPLLIPNSNQLQSLIELCSVASVKLFADRAQSANGGFRINKANASAIAGICMLLAGLPLAVELAASWARQMPPSAILDQLDHWLPNHPVELRDTQAQQWAMTAATNWAFERLVPEHQQLLLQLAVFAGKPDLRAVHAVCVSAKAANVRTALADLADHGLLHQLTPDDGDDVRYAMPRGIREYALRRLRERGEEVAVRGRHAQYYTKLAEDAAPSLYSIGREQASRVQHLSFDEGDLRDALSWAVDNDPTSALRLAIAMGRYWEIRARYAEGLEWCVQALSTEQEAGPGTTALRAEVLWWAARLAGYVDRFRVSSLLETSLALFSSVGDSVGRARVLICQAETLARKGNTAKAFRLYDEGIRSLRSPKTVTSLVDALVSRASVMLECRDPRGALTYAEEAAALTHDIGMDSRQIESLILLAHVLENIGNSERAAKLLDAGLERTRAAGDRRVTSQLLCELGNALVDMGALEWAEALYTECLSYGVETSYPPAYARACRRLAELAYARCDVDRVIELCERSHRLSEIPGLPPYLCDVTPLLGWIALQQGDIVMAEDHCREELLRGERREEYSNAIWALRVLTLVRIAQRKPKAAARLLGVTQSIAENLEQTKIIGYEMDVRNAVENLTAALGEQALSTALTEGRTIARNGWRAALTYALSGSATTT